MAAYDAEERSVIEVVQRGRDKPLTEEEIYLSLEQARALGEIDDSSGARLPQQAPLRPLGRVWPSTPLAASPDLAVLEPFVSNFCWALGGDFVTAPKVLSLPLDAGGGTVPLARDRLAPDTSDFSVPASRACP